MWRPGCLRYRKLWIVRLIVSRLRRAMKFWSRPSFCKTWRHFNHRLFLWFRGEMTTILLPKSSRPPNFHTEILYKICKCRMRPLAYPNHKFLNLAIVKETSTISSLILIPGCSTVAVHGWINMGSNLSLLHLVPIILKMVNSTTRRCKLTSHPSTKTRANTAKILMIHLILQGFLDLICNKARLRHRNNLGWIRRVWLCQRGWLGLLIRSKLILKKVGCRPCNCLNS